MAGFLIYLAAYSKTACPQGDSTGDLRAQRSNQLTLQAVILSRVADLRQSSADLDLDLGKNLNADPDLDADPDPDTHPDPDAHPDPDPRTWPTMVFKIPL